MVNSIFFLFVFLFASACGTQKEGKYIEYDEIIPTLFKEITIYEEKYFLF